MGKPHRRFGREFAAEAVRLVETSGRTQREIAEDLGIELSTPRRWLDKRRKRDLEVPPPDRQEDMAAGVKRLRRENEILRQEREILEGAATFRQGGSEAGPRSVRGNGRTMRFRLIDSAKKELPVQRSCKVLGVSPGGRLRTVRQPQESTVMERSEILGAMAAELKLHG